MVQSGRRGRGRSYGLVHFGLLAALANKSDDAAALFDYVKSGMAAFSCRSQDVTTFLRSTAREYDCSDDARTYLWVDITQSDESQRIGGYIALGLSSLDLAGSTVSRSLKKRLGGPHSGVAPNGKYGVYVIGQLGRNMAIGVADLRGDIMLTQAEDLLRRMSSGVGGRMVIADCEPALFDGFYARYGYEKVAYDPERGLWRIAKRLRVDWQAVASAL